MKLSLLLLSLFSRSWIAIVVSQSVDERLTIGLNSFSISLFKHISDSSGPGNVFVSPFSAAVALSMLDEGSNGETEKQIFNSFDLEMISRKRFKNLLIQRMKNVKKIAGVNIADYMLLQDQSDDNQVFNDYRDLLTSRYDALVDDVDFNADPATIQAQVNYWVFQKTEGLIEFILSEPPPETTSLLLLNAVYFRRQWMKPFPMSATSQEVFYNSGRWEIYGVDFMNLYGQTFNYGETTFAGQDVQVLELQYKNDESEMSTSSMIIILPRAILGLEVMLSSSSFESDISNFIMTPGLFKEAVLNVHIPKFNFGTYYHLKGSLEKMGVTNLFNPFYADMSGINGSPGLYVDELDQRTFISVDESGTAVPSVSEEEVMENTNDPVQEFRANHPFLIQIFDRTNAQILFVGKIETM